jgi:hypothetical protein
MPNAAIGLKPSYVVKPNHEDDVQPQNCKGTAGGQTVAIYVKVNDSGKELIASKITVTRNEHLLSPQESDQSCLFAALFEKQFEPCKILSAKEANDLLFQSWNGVDVTIEHFVNEAQSDSNGRPPAMKLAENAERDFEFFRSVASSKLSELQADACANKQNAENVTGESQENEKQRTTYINLAAMALAKAERIRSIRSEIERFIEDIPKFTQAGAYDAIHDQYLKVTEQFRALDLDLKSLCEAHAHNEANSAHCKYSQQDQVKFDDLYFPAGDTDVTYLVNSLPHNNFAADFGFMKSLALREQVEAKKLEEATAKQLSGKKRDTEINSDLANLKSEITERRRYWGFLVGHIETCTNLASQAALQNDSEKIHDIYLALIAGFEEKNSWDDFRRYRLGYDPALYRQRRTRHAGSVQAAALSKFDVKAAYAKYDLDDQVRRPRVRLTNATASKVIRQIAKDFKTMEKTILVKINKNTDQERKLQRNLEKLHQSPDQTKILQAEENLYETRENLRAYYKLSSLISNARIDLADPTLSNNQQYLNDIHFRLRRELEGQGIKFNFTNRLRFDSQENYFLLSKEPLGSPSDDTRYRYRLNNFDKNPAPVAKVSENKSMKDVNIHADEIKLIVPPKVDDDNTIDQQLNSVVDEFINKSKLVFTFETTPAKSDSQLYSAWIDNDCKTLIGILDDLINEAHNELNKLRHKSNNNATVDKFLEYEITKYRNNIINYNNVKNYIYDEQENYKDYSRQYSVGPEYVNTFYKMIFEEFKIVLEFDLYREYGKKLLYVPLDVQTGKPAGQHKPQNSQQQFGVDIAELITD